MKRFALLFLSSCAALGVAGGCSSTVPTEVAPAASGSVADQASATTTPSAEPSLAKSRLDWRQALAKVPLPGKGCYQASRPDLTWHETPCGNAPELPPHFYYPQRGSHKAESSSALPRKLTPDVGGTGGGSAIAVPGDYYAATTSGLIASAEGSFPSVSGLASQSATTYSLQINTNTFNKGGGLCGKAKTPSACSSWEQFVYDPTAGGVYIQNWLVGFDGTSNGQNCPDSTWTFPTPVPPGAEGGCYKNTASKSETAQPLSNLANLVLIGQAGATQDTVEYSSDGGDTFVSVPGGSSVLGLNGYWKDVEFNVFGDGNADVVAFSSNTTLTTKVAVTSTPSTANPPLCQSGSYTAESSNLAIVQGSCCEIDGLGGGTPAIEFTSTNVDGGTAPACAVNDQLYLNVNNSPLQVAQGGVSEAFVLMTGRWMVNDLGANAVGTVLSTTTPAGVTITPSPGVTIDSTGAVNLTVTAPSTAPTGLYQATFQVTDQASGITLRTIVPIGIVCIANTNVCVSNSQGSPMCGEHAAGCGTFVDCGTCAGGAACGSNGYCPCVPDFTSCGSTETCGSLVNNCGQTIECGTCASGQTCSGNKCCPSGEVNSNGVCCPAGETGGDGICCPAGDVVSAGHCCPSGDVWSGTMCVKPSTGGGGSSSGGGGCRCTKESCNCM